MVSVSTHVLDGAAGGPRIGVSVVLETADGILVGSGSTDAAGRVPELATGLPRGRYRLRWTLDDRRDFVSEVAVVVELAEDRHYHLPLLASGASAVSYLGV
jgi:5-hydroxyisourate hydrolase